MTTSPPSRNKPLLAALATMVMWAFIFPANKAALPFIAAGEIALLRYLIACGCCLCLFAAGKFPPPRLRDLPSIFLLGVAGVTAYQLLFINGVGRVTAGAASMIIASITVFASLMAWIFFRERLSLRAWCGIAVSIAGIAVIVLEKTGDGGDADGLAGYMMLVAAVLLMSVYFVFQKPFFARYSPLAMTSYTSIAGTLPLLYFLPGTVDAAIHAPVTALIPIAIMGVFSTVVAFALWFYALSKLPAGVVTSFLFLSPLVVTVMSWFWLGEIPSLRAFAGGAVVLVGMGLIVAPGRPVNRPDNG